MVEQTVDVPGAQTGTGWRAAAWMAFGLAVVLAVRLMTGESQEFVHAVMRAAGTLFAMLLAVLGVVFAVFGASAAASAGDRRPVLIAPVLANATLLLLVVAAVFAP